MIKESRIHVLISVPDRNDKLTYSRMVRDELRKLMDICKASLPTAEENWEIWPLQAPVMRVYSYAGQQANEWQQDKDSMLLDCACFGVDVDFPDKTKANRKIRAFASIHDKRPVEYRTSELGIRIHIPRSWWNEMDIEVFVKGVQETCCTLGASYAAIDREEICAPSIDDAPFFYFSIDRNRAIYPKEYIPAICWAQFLPLSRIQNSQSVLSHAIPRCHTNLIHHNDQDYVWIQLDDPIWKPKLDTRVAIRQHFLSSFPELDYPKIAKSIKMEHFYANIYWMPLLEHEKEQLMKLNVCDEEEYARYMGNARIWK